MLCDSCGENQASVFLTQIVHGDVTQLRLCETCAREQAADGHSDPNAPLENLVRDLFEHMTDEHRPLDDISDDFRDERDDEIIIGLNIELNEDEFEEDFPDDDELNAALGDDNLNEAYAELPDDLDGALEANALYHFPDINVPDSPRERRDATARRCPKCSITWDRLRQDGRAGCAHCYETFGEQLHEVMQRVQHAPEHRGKKPRAAEKRRSRLEHLRMRRDNRLEMLNRRLEEAVQSERYEEAAKLRDQIKMVASTIVNPEEV